MLRLPALIGILVDTEMFIPRSEAPTDKSAQRVAEALRARRAAGRETRLH